MVQPSVGGGANLRAGAALRPAAARGSPGQGECRSQPVESGAAVRQHPHGWLLH